MGNGVLGVSEDGTGVAGHVTLSGAGVHGHSLATAGGRKRCTRRLAVQSAGDQPFWTTTPAKGPSGMPQALRAMASMAA